MHSRIQQLELELMTPNARSDELRLRELLHPQFIEVGRSGTLWTRESIIASLRANPRVHAPYVDEWVFVDIAERLVLVTYRTRDNSRHGYRVSGTLPCGRRLNQHLYCGSTRGPWYPTDGWHCEPKAAVA